MSSSNSVLESLSSADLLAATRDLVGKSRGVEADLLIHLGEIDQRRIYLERAFPSMFAFCVHDLGFSEDASYNRITVARAARMLPAIIDCVRMGQVHLAGLRLLVPHLTLEGPREKARDTSSRHIPDSIKREVYERDGGRCTFSDERGRRCGETGALEFDHIDGFARTHRHDVDRIRLLCRAHNQYAAEQIYGRTFMEQVRAPP